MANTFKTPVVHEMTRDEYWQQRRRVIESLKTSDPRAVPALVLHARG
jgi:hypothetical protein